jgi:hypothetical protein
VVRGEYLYESLVTDFFEASVRNNNIIETSYRDCTSLEVSERFERLVGDMHYDNVCSKTRLSFGSSYFRSLQNFPLELLRHSQRGS